MSDIHVETQDLLLAQGKFNTEDSLDYQQWLDQQNQKAREEQHEIQSEWQ